MTKRVALHSMMVKLGEPVKAPAIHAVYSRGKPAIAVEYGMAWRRRRDSADLIGIEPHICSYVPVPALQCPKRFDEPDLAAGRFFLCLEICLWLQPFFAGIFAAAVFRTHLRLRTRAWRRRCISFAERYFDRLRQACGG